MRRQAEEAVGRADARQRHAEGRERKKVVAPAARRQAVTHLCKAHGVSHATARQAIAEQSAERGRACSVLQIDRSTVR